MRLPASGVGNRGRSGVAVKPGDEVTVHQLLGRIAYFHALFIEPALTSDERLSTDKPCCSHQDYTGSRPPSVPTESAGTAWTVLDEIARALGKHLVPYPRPDRHCCAICRVAASGTAIAQAWTITEHRAYHRPPPTGRLLQVCSSTAAARLAHVFAEQHGTHCRALAQTEAADTSLLPESEELPLTGELLALWQDPLAATSPVVSWLNHCTDLNDIYRVLQQRGTTK